MIGCRKTCFARRYVIHSRHRSKGAWATLGLCWELLAPFGLAKSTGRDGLGREEMLRRKFGQPVLRIEELEQRALLAADVYISEIAATNQDLLVDEDGDSPDWIEISNAGTESVNLSGWHLTDDAETLTKWSFPSQNLAPGEVLLVYASDKDRAEAGSPLHTNFKLTSAGEYLGLTRTLDANTIEVVSEFAPQYPTQVTDVSYGVAQTVDETVVAAGDAAGKYFMPTDDALGNAWTQVNFDDSAWTESIGGIGYQNIVPGFTVQNAAAEGTIENLTEALAVLAGEGQASETTVIVPTVDFTDNSFGGFFEGGDDFPNGTAGDDNDFAVRVTGIIELPTSGNWILGFLSDDGGRMLIDGEVIINDDVLRGPEFSFEQLELSAGQHEIEVIYFERGGGAELEIFAGQSFEQPPILIGDVENGGLPVFTSGGSGSAAGVGGLFATDVGEAMLGVSTDAYLRVPFNLDDPSTLDSLTMRVNYDDGFVAYLNGIEIARRNAPDGDVNANAQATATRERFDTQRTETIDISSFVGELKQGQNVLAIHALNDTIDSNSFLLRAELVEVDITAGDLLYFPTPTPGAFNPSTGVVGFLTNEISMGQPHGYYDEPFELTLSTTTPETTIRYTVDGSEPTTDNGMDYTGPIPVASTVTIRARAFKDGLDPSFVETASYFFLDDVLTQTRQTALDLGFPRSANGQSYDFGMDPDIVESDEWGPQLKAAFEQIPTMSVVMDVDDFASSETGIYSNASSHGKAWERPASLELIHPDGSQGFQVNMGIRVRGGFSRTGSNPKHAFRFFFRDEYGNSKLEYPLFGDEGVAEFDKMDLRTTQNYSWAFQGDARNAFVRDVFSRDMQREMGHPYTRSRYYHLYINGQYWGLFQTQERAEARYAASYFGGSPEDYDVVKSGGNTGGYANEATDGNLDAYFRLAEAFYSGLGDDNFAEYMQVQGMNTDGTRNPEFERLLDVENLIDYMIITYFTGDRDGPASRFVTGRVNNYFAIINRENPDGFKFFEHDSEHSLDTGESNMVSPLTSGGAFESFFNPHWMHEQLAQSNTEYRTQFMDRVYETLFNDGVLSPGQANALIDSRASEIDMAIIAESARWGDSRRGTPFTKDDWESAVESAKLFVSSRASTLLGQLRAVNWYPDGNAPGFLVNDEGQRGGVVAATDVISFDNAASLEFRRRFIREQSSWRWLNDRTDPGTEWLDSEFDDEEWQSGRAPLGYGDGDERSTVDFGEDADDKPVTTYFRKTFNATDIEQFQAIRLSLLTDDGAVVYLNGEEVLRLNMPEGEINLDTGALTEKEFGENNYMDVLLPRELLLEGTNVLGVEVHQVVDADGKVRDDDMSFDASLYGGTLVPGEPVELYYTTDGSDPRLQGGEISASAEKFETGFQLPATSEVRVRAKAGDAWGVLNRAQFVVASLEGDLNEDGMLSDSDIDVLAAAIRVGTDEARYDVNGDDSINEDDLDFMIQAVFKTRAGDTDLDGDVDFADFLNLSANFGKDISNWAQGNFDTSTDTAFADFLALSANFGFDNEE